MVWARLVIVAAAGCISVVMPGCMDMEPITVQGELAERDGGRDGAVRSVCEESLYPSGDAASPCGAVVATCAATARCHEIIRCMLDEGCFELFVSEEVNRCSLPCVLGAGVTSSEDLGLAAAFDVAFCSADEYATCFPEPADASAP